MAEVVTLPELATELGMDRSNMRKYVLKNGFQVLQVRTPESKGQLVLALSQEDAEAVRESRMRQGFLISGVSGVSIEVGSGSFYIVQIVPDLDEHRVKFGFATDTMRRLDSYKTISPSAQLVKMWPCRASWEIAAIASICRVGCVSMGGEVFTCDSLESIVERGDAFFEIMPSIAKDS